MRIQCDKCGSVFNVPDEKIPEGKTFFVGCPKCKNRLSIEAPKKEEIMPPLSFDEQEAQAPSIAFDEGEDDLYDAEEKPFDFIEEEGTTALICEPDPKMRGKIKIALDLMEYSVSIADGTRDALKKMRYHNYDVVVINENFDSPNPDTNGVVIFLNRMQMMDRRNMVVFLVSDRYRTMDNMAAFHRSANVVINVNDIEKVDIVLQKGITENEMFYKIFKEYEEKIRG
jgi:predicted Zn finger-like uncharacterized protein